MTIDGQVYKVEPASVGDFEIEYLAGGDNETILKTLPVETRITFDKIRMDGDLAGADAEHWSEQLRNTIASRFEASARNKSYGKQVLVAAGDGDIRVKGSARVKIEDGTYVDSEQRFVFDLHKGFRETVYANVPCRKWTWSCNFEVDRGKENIRSYFVVGVQSDYMRCDQNAWSGRVDELPHSDVTKSEAINRLADRFHEFFFRVPKIERVEVRAGLLSGDAQVAIGCLCKAKNSESPMREQWVRAALNRLSRKEANSEDLMIMGVAHELLKEPDKALTCYERCLAKQNVNSFEKAKDWRAFKEGPLVKALERVRSQYSSATDTVAVAHE